ncbi:hypothetical protein SAMN05216276_106232 [Streptosporangium subroseum]|uniref:Uncharacterized protein n=1 Tax=Streptosporangium subroseum TaxID=106412 RepID=A0A239NMY4_9ACTN|nr:hypothetical protein SAMN05216276_106232 [Streptosporangium subroseum]
MLNPVRDTHVARAAVARAIEALKNVLNTRKAHS